MPKGWKAPLYLLLFGLLTVYAIFFRNPDKITAPANLQTSSNGLELIIQPESGRGPLLDKINSAQKELLIEVYLLSDPQIISAVKEASSRGVAVKILLEKNPFGGGNLNQNTFVDLQNSSVAVKWSNPTFALTHEKALIVDSQVVCVLNQNLTQSSFTKNREYDICLENPPEVTQARNIFAADWDRQNAPLSDTSLVVSPETSRTKLESLISSAKKSLDIEMEIVGDNQILSLLSEKAKTISVRLIIPSLARIPSNQPSVSNLKSSGVQVRQLSSPYLHAKLIIADEVRAYLGSINLSTASFDQNRELGIIVSQLDTLERLNASFASDWAIAVE